MPNFLDAVSFHLARYIVGCFIGGALFLVALLYVIYKNNSH